MYASRHSHPLSALPGPITAKCTLAVKIYYCLVASRQVDSGIWLIRVSDGLNIIKPTFGGPANIHMFNLSGFKQAAQDQVVFDIGGRRGCEWREIKTPRMVWYISPRIGAVMAV